MTRSQHVTCIHSEADSQSIRVEAHNHGDLENEMFDDDCKFDLFIFGLFDGLVFDLFPRCFSPPLSAVSVLRFT